MASNIVKDGLIVENKHNTQPQRVSKNTLNPDTVDTLVDDCTTLGSPYVKLELIVGAINVARNETEDPELKLLFQKILRAAGVTVG